MQSNLMSLFESLTNVLIRFGVAVTTQYAIFPLFGLRATLAENLAMGAVFTVVSLARSYCLRRVFERLRIRAESATPPDDDVSAAPGLFKRSDRRGHAR